MSVLCLTQGQPLLCETKFRNNLWKWNPILKHISARVPQFWNRYFSKDYNDWIQLKHLMPTLQTRQTFKQVIFTWSWDAGPVFRNYRCQNWGTLISTQYLLLAMHYRLQKSRKYFSVQEDSKMVVWKWHLINGIISLTMICW